MHLATKLPLVYLYWVEDVGQICENLKKTLKNNDMGKSIVGDSK
ncbi:hypothetical protein JCM19235_4263 [Vibrio maritimus]|uniref:Uncharacterized protein n=1 Tax=Vibrio maritimus TaxID=990268 RepID=A0A090RZV7_9VIBR|nr:hypothetical protein JCM19235_4263 [Vibrio maritimus]